MPVAAPRLWQVRLVERLAEAGHQTSPRDAGEARMAMLDMLLSVEALRFGGGLLSRTAAAEPARRSGSADLVVDLSGAASSAADGVPVLGLLFDGHPSPAAAAGTLSRGGLPVLTATLDGRPVAEARPMVDDRLWLSRALDDVLARAITLVERCVRRFAEGRLAEDAVRADLPAAGSARGPGPVHWLGMVPELAGRLWHKAFYQPFHWQVGYRFLDGPGLAAGPDGPPWLELDDDGSRFYADPFPFEHEGRHFLFVEDFPHDAARGLISVAEASGERFSVPRPVLEEPFHLSYPQVFGHGGEIWMIPETMAARSVILYRATRFPDRWIRERVLIEDRALSDATLVEHGGRFWLFASDRDGAGSASDCLAVYHAPALTGPFVPHRDNPVVIDRTCGRPGGAFIRERGRLFLPVQDGTLGYGGGLGLVEIERLDGETVRLGAARPLAASGWPHPRLHTLNRAGRLETIDGFVLRRRPRAG